MYLDTDEEIECKIFENKTPVTHESKIEVTNDSGHWLDSMLDSDE